MSKTRPAVRTAITTSEAAKILGVDARTIQRRAERREIPIFAKLPGVTGAYLFDADEIAKLRDVLA